MKNDFLNILKKELLRFFTDRRMVLATILLPGLMIYVLYSFMGNAFGSMFGPSEDKAQVFTVHMPAAVSTLLQSESLNLKVTEISEAEASSVQDKIKEETAELLIIFPSDFDSAISEYSTASGLPAPDIKLYYNSTSTGSSLAYQIVLEALDAYESSMSNLFDVNRDNANSDLADTQDFASQMMSSMLPFLLTVLMFSSCMGIVPESIAGEKERGTIATLLVTPMKRSQLAMGKIAALGIIALCSGVSSFLGTFLSLPRLMQMSGAESSSFNIYGISDYVLLLLTILSLLLLFVSMISLISAYANSVKEASSLVMPLMILVMLVGVSSLFGGHGQAQLGYYLIPVYNSIQSMLGIFSREASMPNLIVAVASNLLYSGIAAFVLTKMFNSERIIYSN